MKNTLFFALAMMAERMVSFFLLPVLTKIVTPVEYAIWSQSVIITGMMLPVAMLGFQTAMIKFFPLWNGEGRTQNSVTLFMLLAVLALSSLISVFAVFFDGELAKLIFGDQQMAFYVPLLIGLLFSEVLFEFLVGVLRATDRIRRVSLYLLLKGVWRIGTLILVLIGMGGDFYLAFWSFVSFQLFITLMIYLKEINPITLIRSGLHFGQSHWAEVFKFSLPLVPLAVLSAVNTFVDRLFITHFHNLEMLATYSAGFSLAAIIAFFYSVLGFTLFPELSKKWANKDEDGIIRLMRKVIVVYLALLLPFVVAMAVAGSEVLLLLTTEDYVISATVITLLSCNLGLFGLYQIAFYLILLKRGSSFAPILMAVIAGINIIFNALLVPDYGMIGAATAGLISNSFLVVTTFYLSKRSLRWVLPLRESAVIFARALCMGVIIWLGIKVFGSENPLVLMSILAIAGLAYALLDYLDKRSSLFSIIR